MINVVIDKDIMFAEEAFSSLGNARLIPGRNICKNDVLDADVLITRSITKVNEKLLRGTKIKFVGTATIGNDHIDLEYLRSQNIMFADAAGSNADAVVEYVFTAILKLAVEDEFTLKGKSIGIIGVGNIGSRVARLSSSLGMNVLKNDPPLKRLTHREDYLELEEVLNADIVTLHVPLIIEGEDKTYHLFGNKTLNKLKDGCILINASRGPVIDNIELEKIIEKKKLRVIVDVWEDEPLINKSLLKKTKIGSPHIAGYSFEGKVNGTVMIYKALCNFLNVKENWTPSYPSVKNNELIVTGENREESLNALFDNIYNINNDDEMMRRILGLNDDEANKYFDSLRNDYPLRREFSNFKIKITNNKSGLENILKNFRFQII